MDIAFGSVVLHGQFQAQSLGKGETVIGSKTRAALLKYEHPPWHGQSGHG